MQEQQLEQLRTEVLQMAQIAQIAFVQAWHAFQNADHNVAKQVIIRDEKLNVLAEKIFKMSLRLIALEAPVAADLRTICSYLKIVTDLERIGDLAVDISKAVTRLGEKPYHLPLFEIPTMGEKVKEILELSIHAISSNETKHLRLLDDMDDVIDAYYNKCFNCLEISMEQNSEYVKEGVQFIKILQALERVGDHATNIGEWELYISTGSMADLNT
jgi:phosphate transport system protein